ncbi:FAD-dependent oxidoreductase, partial [Escherichia coli]|nr:FAD-dependent oxidoreductase [Escherichia coli]
ENGGRVTGIRAGEMLIEADRVVVAAGAWTDYLLTTLNLPLIGIKPIRGQIMAYFKTALQPKRIVINSRFYAVPRNDGRLIIG